jgi:hypothetical protein
MATDLSSYRLPVLSYGNFSKSRHWVLADEFIIGGYLIIIISVVWMIIKFISLKPPEEDTD